MHHNINSFLDDETPNYNTDSNQIKLIIHPNKINDLNNEIIEIINEINGIKMKIKVHTCCSLIKNCTKSCIDFSFN